MDGETPKKSIYTFELDEGQQTLLLALMSGGNYRRREVPYSICSIEGDKFNATLYEKARHGKRKLCVQGSGAQDFVEFQLEPNGVVAVSLGYEKILHPELFSAHAGSDESGKGDYFGPLVVCCVYTDERLSEEMQKLGVKDCKQMSDKAVLAAGAALRRLLGPDGYSFVKLGPAAYNRLYAKMKNINRMLAWAHGTAIEDLLGKRPGCPRVVVDQFARVPKVDAEGNPVKDEYGHACEDVARSQAVLTRALKERGKKAAVEQRHRAESDIAVAAASVIARELFIRAIGEMSRECFGGDVAAQDGIPMGSSDPRVRSLAEEMVRKNGPVWLMNHCKAHFQTTDKVLAACGLSRADLPPEGRICSAALRG